MGKQEDSPDEEAFHGNITTPLRVGSKVVSSANITPVPTQTGTPRLSSPAHFALQIVPSGMACPESRSLSPWPYRVVQSAGTLENPDRSSAPFQVADQPRTHSPYPTSTMTKIGSQSGQYLQPQFPNKLQTSGGSAVVPVASPRQQTRGRSAVVSVASPRQQ